MEARTAQEYTGWRRVDRAAFGIIYGAIMVLGILLGAHADEAPPAQTAGVLFGSVLAITLAKTFAELLSHALDTGERMTRSALHRAWVHSRPTIAAANLPTFLFLGAAAGLISADQAVVLAQAVCVALLTILGGRVGWVIDGRLLPAVLGALFAAGVGIGLAALKFVIH